MNTESIKTPKNQLKCLTGQAGIIIELLLDSKTRGEISGNSTLTHHYGVDIIRSNYEYKRFGFYQEKFTFRKG